MTKQNFLDLGGKEWQKDDKERVYINSEIFNKIMDTSFSDSKNKFFYDCKTKSLMRSYKNKKPTVEKQF